MTSTHATPKRGTTELPLAGEEERRYLSHAVGALGVARLSHQFPDARQLAAHLGCLSPEVHRGLYRGLSLDVRSGLPCYREWTRLQADQELAARALAELPARAELEDRARATGAAIHGKRLLKHDYYSALAGHPAVALSSLTVQLRRVTPEECKAQFHIRFDKLDLSGLVVRYSIDLEQQASLWNRRMVTLSEETAGQTEALRTMVYQMAGTDAELLFAQLAAVAGLRVEQVVKGTVGPFFCRGTRVPTPLMPLVASERGLIATFGLDRAAVDQTADRNNDPLADTLAETLSEEAHRAYVAARARWGYRVFKDRKFVVPSALVEGVRVCCRELGTNNIIYTLPA